jgi:tRNA modification GTPase
VSDCIALSRGDTIAAIATPAGVGGVCVVRVSGPEAIRLVAESVGRAPAALPDRRLVRGKARALSGEPVDEVLVVAMRGPRSFTGEDVAEVHGHGGAVNTRRLLRMLLERGARLAEPGEFSRRAVENGRMDLAQAEALAEVIGATSERGWRLAQAQLRGVLGQRVSELRARLTGLLAELEAGIDFPDEDLELGGIEALGRAVRALRAEVVALADSFQLGRVLREGITVALVGAVNAGKSSLFNALLGTERALVAAEPGTTRDFVESQAVWAGVQVTLVDTAGRRATDSQVERRGIELGSRRAEEAELEVEVVARPDLETGRGTADGRRLLVVSKSDLGGRPVPEGWLATSAHTGEGLDELREAIVARVTGRAGVEGEGVTITSERHRDLLVACAAALETGASLLGARAPRELVAIEVRDAAARLAAITGEGVGEEVLDALFARFCIGK